MHCIITLLVSSLSCHQLAEGLHFSALGLLPEAHVDGHGYSSLLVCLSVCLFVMSISTHLDAIALRLQHG